MPFQGFNPSSAIAIASSSQSGPIATGWLSFLQLRTELSYRLGGRADLDAARLGHWVNEAYVDMTNAFDLAVLRTTLTHTLTAGVVLYSLPANVRMAVLMSYQDPLDQLIGCKVDKIEEDEYRRLPIEAFRGPPEVWSPFHPNLLVVYPSPDEAYPVALDVKLRPSRLVADVDFPVLTEEYIEGLLLLARAKAFSALLEFSLAGQSTNEYVAFMRSRRNEVAEQDEGKIGRIIPVRSQSELLTSVRRINYGV